MHDINLTYYEMALLQAAIKSRCDVLNCYMEHLVYDDVMLREGKYE